MRCFLAIGDKRSNAHGPSRRWSQPTRERSCCRRRRTTRWHFLNNNLGYSLNQIGRHGEAEAYTRAAIAIDPGRHNAHKNLVISLQGQGNYLEAPRSFLRATHAQPDDVRALDHLEDLLAKHEEIGTHHPEILEAVQECREAARTSRRERVR